MNNMNTTHHNHHTRAASQTPRWSKEQIREARMIAIAPLLEKRGMHLIESGGGNYLIREHPGLIIKDSYWRHPERGAGGNAIDLLTQILRLSFNDAMLELSQTHDARESAAAPNTS
jgi:hypothetical protein